MVEDDFEHGYTTKTREATYAFFQKHLGVPGSPRDEAVELIAPEELHVTPTGQVATSLGGESFFSVTLRAAGPLVAALERSRRDSSGHLDRVRRAARQLSGYEPPQEKPAPLFAGRYQRESYRVEKHMLEGEGRYPVPFLVLAPDRGGRHPAVVYLHPKGKAAEAGVRREMDQLVQKGFVVLAPDLPGIGETAPNQDAWEMAMLIGRSLVGLRAGDIVRLVRTLQARPDVDPNRIGGVARGELGAELLHAATFEPAISRVALVDPLISWRALLEEELYAQPLSQAIVARALTAYDLPDLAAGLAPRPLEIVNPRNGRMDPASAELMQRDLAVVRSSYSAMGAMERFIMYTTESDREAIEGLAKTLN
jgi:hypothetical protein